jgi:hypothetical protein
MTAGLVLVEGQLPDMSHLVPDDIAALMANIKKVSHQTLIRKRGMNQPAVSSVTPFPVAPKSIE